MKLKDIKVGTIYYEEPWMGLMRITSINKGSGLVGVQQIENGINWQLMGSVSKSSLTQPRYKKASRLQILMEASPEYWPKSLKPKVK